MRARFLFPALAGCGAIALSAGAFADHPSVDFGTGAAGPIVTISAATLPAGKIALGARAEYVRSAGLSNDELASRAERRIEAHSLDDLLSLSVSGAYGVTDDLTLAIRLPYVRRAGIREAHAESGTPEIVARGDSAGVGDLGVLGKYRFVGDAASAWQAALLLGVKAPTGATSERDGGGEPFETEHQPGSGSWDSLFGLALTRRSNPASLDASLLYSAAGEGAQDTRLGDRASYSAAISYRMTGEGHDHHGESSAPHAHDAWDAILELNGEWEGRHTIAGITEPESGGNIAYFSPGIRYVSSNGWSAFLSIGLPILQHVRLSHSDTESRVVAGIGWAP